MQRIIGANSENFNATHPHTPAGRQSSFSLREHNHVERQKVHWTGQALSTMPVNSCADELHGLCRPWGSAS